MQGTSSGYARFVGRENELRDVRGLLEPSRVITLTGIGGTGKSRIAEQIVGERLQAGDRRCWSLGLADLSEPAFLVHALAAEVGLQVQGTTPMPDGIAEYIGTGPALLLIDNCEHLVAEVGDVVSSLLARCPGLEVLCTSQIPLGLAAEVVYSVPPLGLPAPDSDLVALGQSDAVRLFVERAQAALPGFALEEANAAAVTRLVIELGGVPLAVELAAARIRVLSPEAIADRFAERLADLGSGPRDGPIRQRSLAASMDWTYELCSDDERALWCRLSVFVGGFDLASAEQVVTGEGIDPDRVLDLLSGLVDRSVLVRVPGSISRFRMLEITRRYGVDQLVAAGDLERWQRRHLDWFAEVSADLEATWFGPDQSAWLERLDTEHANLRAVHEYAVAEPDPDPEAIEIALALCYRLQPYWVCTGQLSEARIWADRALAHDAGSDALRARVAAMGAFMAALQFDVVYASEILERARVHAELAGDDAVEGYYLYAAGLVRIWRLEVVEGLALLEEGLEKFRGTDDVYGYTRALQHVGLNVAFHGDRQRAAALQNEVLQIAGAVGESSVRSYAQWALGFTVMREDEDHADRLFRDSLALSWTLRDPLGIGLRLEGIALIAAQRGRDEYAATVLGSAAAIWKRINVPVDHAPYAWGQDSAGSLLAYRLRLPVERAAAYAAGMELDVGDAVRFALEQPEPPAEVLDPAQASVLTRREQEVADLVAEGLSNRAIATRLFLSERTAQGHVQNILRKLDVNSRAQIATWVVRQHEG